MTKAEKCFMLLSATFQFTIVNFKQLYNLGFLLKLTETALDGKVRKSAFMWIKLAKIWSYRLGDIGQKVQHVQVGTLSTASGKWFQLTYCLVTYPRTLYISLNMIY